MTKGITAFLILAAVLVQGQGMNFGAPHMMNDNPKMENYRIYQMTDYLELTPEQATLFFPKQRQYMENERIWFDGWQKETRDYFEANRENLNEEVTRELVKRMKLMEEKRINNRVEFLNGLFDILTPKQIAKLMFFEDDFRKHLRDELEHRNNKFNRR